MPVIDEHKTVFVHVPKTGGTSILEMFNFPLEYSKARVFGYKDYMNGQRVELSHLSYYDILRLRPDAEAYFSFGFCRNPYDRLVSEYHFENDRLIKRGKSFAQFVYNLYNKDVDTYDHFLNCHYIPQHELLEGVDEVYRFEDIEYYAKRIKEVNGLDKDLEHHNATERDSWVNYYDNNLRNMVYEMYYKDFEIYGYEY